VGVGDRKSTRLNSGQLGNGNDAFHTRPVQGAALSGVKAIAAGGYHSVALKNDGTVWSSGWNVLGQLGNGTTTQSLSPVKTSLENIATISAGGYPDCCNHALEASSGSSIAYCAP
jgi:alpha-tubulin suppressor-like RCC1 family protein